MVLINRGEILILLYFLLFININTFSQKIFPGSIGFGTESRGAYAGNSKPAILTVDTLYAGSLRTGENSGSFEWCITQNYPRIILFKVSGVIDYSASARPYININHPYLNVYGQTAPDKGVTLFGAEIYTNTHDLLIQHLKFRQYDKNPHRLVNRCIGVVAGSYNIVFDHCSFSFANDEIFTIWEAEYNITLSNSIISFPLHESNHANEGGRKEPEAHGFSIIDKADSCISYIGNFFAYGTYRFPMTDNLKTIIQNNFNYASAARGIAGPVLSGSGNKKYIIKGNKFIHSLNTNWNTYSVDIRISRGSQSKIWIEDNISLRKIENPGYSEWACISNQANCIEPNTIPFDTIQFPSINSASVESNVYKYAGAFYWNRDWIDQLAIDSVKARTFNYINCPKALPARAYNRDINEGLKTTNGNMQNGYNFNNNNVRFTVNSAIINLTTYTSSLDQVLALINSQLPSGYEAVRHVNPECPFIIIQSIATGRDQSITIGGNASVFGIPNGTFYGENGIGGYPSFISYSRDLDIPQNPHNDNNGNGYSNLEDWVHGLNAYEDSCKGLTVKGIVTNSEPKKNNGVIQTIVYGGTPGYSYFWENGLKSNNRYNLSEGHYSVIVSDNVGCIVRNSWSISEISLPYIVKSYVANVVGGQVEKVDYSKSKSVNGNNLKFSWITPNNLQISSKEGNAISYLPPIVEKNTMISIIVMISDDINMIIDTLKIYVTPYDNTKQKLSINAFESSGFEATNYPENTFDNDFRTRWSVDGIGEYLVYSLSEPSSINHIYVSFYNRSTKKALFEISASFDGIIWDKILPNIQSSGFSDGQHLYIVSQAFNQKFYNYVKLTGNGNTLDTWNSFTEFIIYGGTIDGGVVDLKGVSIYPNPVISELNVNADFKSIINIYNMEGKIIYSKLLPEGFNTLNLKLNPGIFFVKVKEYGTNRSFSKKIIAY